MKIDSWEELLDFWMEEDEEGVVNLNREFTWYMTRKFERIYLRTVGRIVKENTIYAATRPTVRVIARKPRARRGRRRK